MHGQKKLWNDVVVRDLYKGDMYPYWSKQAQNCSTWRGWIYASAEKVNEEMEVAEQNKKTEHKQRREASNQEMHQGPKCSVPWCPF